jgi:hypothetical protein
VGTVVSSQKDRFGTVSAAASIPVHPTVWRFYCTIQHMRRLLLILTAAFTLFAGRAEAVTIRDLIELSKAGLGDQVLIALIEVDRGVFAIDPATLKQLKDGGVSEAVIVALIRSGRTPRPEPAPVPAVVPEPEPRERDVVVIDHRDAPAPAPVAYPVPVYIPVPTQSRRSLGHQTVTTILPTDQGLVKARVPVPNNCVKAEPVYWGFGG